VPICLEYRNNNRTSEKSTQCTLEIDTIEDTQTGYMEQKTRKTENQKTLIYKNYVEEFYERSFLER
jgi:hypothetical protein